MALHSGILEMDTDTRINPDQGSQSAPVSPSSSTCSSMYAPSLDPRDSNSSLEHRTPPPVSITNFCIDEILKPDFGRNLFSKSGVHDSAFVPWNIATSSASIAKHQQDLRALYEQRLGALRLQYDLSVRPQRPAPIAPHTWPGSSHKLNATKDKYKHSSPRRKIADAVPDRRNPSPQPDPDETRVKAPRGGPKSASVAEDRDCRQSKESNSTCDGRSDEKSDRANEKNQDGQLLWPAWVYCTRYSDRPSSGPRSRKVNRSISRKADDKRPRTAFTNEQLQKLKTEFELNRYLTEERRHKLAAQLELNESQIKIWFQNKRAKIKKTTTMRNGLALHLMEQGLYNHSTVPVVENGDV